jgi:hypothetical protein
MSLGAALPSMAEAAAAPKPPKPRNRGQFLGTGTGQASPWLAARLYRRGQMTDGPEGERRVEAPSKHFVWFEHSGHLPMIEEPGKYLLALMAYARPLAKPVGDPV